MKKFFVGACALAMLSMAVPVGAQESTPTADIQVTVLESIDPVKSNKLVTHTVEITNNGPNDTEVVAQVAWVDEGLAAIGLLSFKPRGRCAQDGNAATCTLGILEEGETDRVTLVFQPLGQGTLTTSASATGVLADPDTANNSDSETTTVRRGGGR